MVDSDAVRIEKAIRKVQESGDESDLIEILLQDALNWPLADEGEENIEIDDISYSWDDVLVEMGFSNADAPVELRQVMPFPNWPHGIFIVRFGSNKFFTQGRGMTTPLRTILRALMEKVRPTADHPSWKKEHLLFLCHSETDYFRFARFENPKGDAKTSKLQIFGWGPSDHIRTVCEYNLKNLIYREGVNEEEASEIVASAFDVNRVSKKFYDDYRNKFELAKPFIRENSDRIDEDEIHQATQILFNRILFLRFIEKKGWLHFGESSDYLRELFNAGGIDSSTFYSSRLKPLFVEGLAIEGRQSHSAYGEVPFLNGGLFEESDLDKAIRDLPNEMFEPLIGENGLFYSYNFTVLESTPLDVDVAIDPEMIGTLFEELVTGRDEKGAFYTPRPVVSYMCKEAIKSVLTHRTDIDVETIRRLVDDNDSEGMVVDDARTINSVLAEVKAIDPACGSGAYLLGLLHELVRIHTKLSTRAIDLRESRTEMKLRIISNSIYGVDIDKFATIQASLRLWLSISVDAIEPELMPNLDMNIVYGDSLLHNDPHWVKKLENWDPVGNLARAGEMSIIRNKYISSSGFEKVQLREKWKELYEEIIESKGADDSSQGVVDYGAIFYDVFVRDNGGFDIVLANPPYVRQEDIDRYTKSQGKKNYPSLVSGKSDLYIYFYARTKQLLRNGGVSCFICSNTWLDVEFGAPLQIDIIENFKAIKIIDFRKMRIFESAEVNTIISIMEKGKSEDDIEFIMLEGSFNDSINDPELRTEQIISKDELIKRASDAHGRYVGYKWSLILRAPEIYHSLIENHSDKFLAVRDICKRTQRNNLRVLPEGFEVLAESAGSIKDRAPFLHSFKDVKGIKLDLSQQKSISHPSVRRSMENVKFRCPDIISNRFYGARIFFIQGGEFFVNDSFFIGQLHHDRYSVKNTILALNSTLSLLFVELRGRKGQGGGVLTFYGPEFTGHQIIDPTLLDGIDDAVYDSLVNREIGEVFVECGFAPEVPIREQTPSPLPDRKTVDDLIFDILGLNREERNEVYWYLCEAVQNRNTRSKSV